MPRCPLCRSALVTITFGLYPTAICTSCNARWIQDGRQQRAINQIQEPTLFASAQRALALGPRTLAHGPQSLLARPTAHPHARSHRDTGPCLLRGRATVIHHPPARLRQNSDQPTAITDVLVATAGSSSRTGDIRWAPPPAQPQPPGRWALYPNGDQVVVVWPGGALAGPPAEVARELDRLGTAAMTWTVLRSGRSGSS